MINPIDIIRKYYDRHKVAYEILLAHSQEVAQAAVMLGRKYNAQPLDLNFVYEAAMLHDIGIFRCKAPLIGCYGEARYIMHGHLGAELLREEGLPRHAFVAERHTGSGLMPQDIERLDLPLPKDGAYYPMTVEERIVCYADKFFSKKHPNQPNSREAVVDKLCQYGHDTLLRFLALEEEFGRFDDGAPIV